MNEPEVYQLAEMSEKKLRYTCQYLLDRLNSIPKTELTTMELEIIRYLASNPPDVYYGAEYKIIDYPNSN